MRSLLRRIVGQTGDLEHDEGDETCIYAVGDIHGHADLLHEICARIDADIRQFRPRGRSRCSSATTSIADRTRAT